MPEPCRRAECACRWGKVEEARRRRGTAPALKRGTGSRPCSPSSGHELVERDEERDEVDERERPLEQPARVPVAGVPCRRHLGGAPARLARNPRASRLDRF